MSNYYGWDHTSVVYNGDIYGQQQLISDAKGKQDRILPLKPAYAFGAGNNPDGSPHHNIEDDRCYLFQIRWETNADGTQTIQLWADVYNGTTNTDGLQMVMTHTDDMLTKVFAGNSIMRFGFTGSTGGSINEQTICLLGENLKPFAQDDYASIPMNTTAVIDVESNDNDPDGDELHVPVIVEPAINGAATIFEDSGINFMRYIPNTNYVGLDSIAYVTCDVNSTKCYAKCDTAWVYINVGCIPFDLSVNMLSPNTLCDATFPQNGAAIAQVTGGPFGIFWSETFDGLPDGTKSTAKWVMDDSNAAYDDITKDHAEVRNNKISISDIGNPGSGKYVTWSSEEIDISGRSNISITVDLIASDKMESGDGQDFINVYYKVDGGVEIPMANGLHKGGSFTAKASASSINGNKVQVIIRATNSSNNEIYWVDDIILSEAGAGTANINYNWYKGSVANGTPDFTGQIYNNMSSGEYTVIAKDLNTGCLSSTQTIIIDSLTTKPFGGYIKQKAPFTSCILPDGQLEAGVFNGTDSTHVGYLFKWFVQEDPTDIIQTGHIASGLRAREYSVKITDLSTGCDTTLNKEVINTVAFPVVSASKISDITSCTAPNSGVGQADVAGLTAGYTFEWYKGPSIGSGLPDFTGSTVSTFPAGMFTVQATDNVSMCKSDQASITINDVTILPILNVEVLSQQISCDPLSPLGELSGTVDLAGIPTTAGYSFNWFRGKNNLAANLVSTNSVATGLSAGIYRAIVTEDATNCSTIRDTLITDNTSNPPAITATSSNVTACDAPNGRINISVAAGENVADYIFELYSGNGVVAANLLQSSTSPLFDNLSAGDYTVIGKNAITKCATNAVTRKIKNAKVNPSATILAQDQVSCDPGVFTGSLSVTAVAVGVLTDYSFAWYQNSVAGVPLASTSAITAIDSGNYALVITDNVSKCSRTYSPRVNQGTVQPAESVTSVASTFCEPNGNGELHGSVIGQIAPLPAIHLFGNLSTTAPFYRIAQPT
ncbi:MAG: hypothetical protein HC819_15090 [Cyclobacteriaceae bacterium]|nr:hypothetical protein [Cyclobacteriaceae bacterium]